MGCECQDVTVTALGNPSGVVLEKAGVAWLTRGFATLNPWLFMGKPSGLRLKLHT